MPAAVSALGPAVMAEFSKAAGLDSLLGAGNRERKTPEPTAGHAAPVAPAPATSLPLGAPARAVAVPTDLLQIMIVQLDAVASALLKVEPEHKDTLKPIAEGFQPLLQHYAGQGDNLNVLWCMAIMSLLGLAGLKYQKVQLRAGVEPAIGG